MRFFNLVDLACQVRSFIVSSFIHKIGVRIPDVQVVLADWRASTCYSQ